MHTMPLQRDVEYPLPLVATVVQEGGPPGRTKNNSASASTGTGNLPRSDVGFIGLGVTMR